MIGLIGISYKTAPINIRENFSFSEEEVLNFVKLLKIDNAFKGAIIISTCNRTEIYFEISQCCNNKGFEHVTRSLAYFKNYSDTFKPYFYFKQGDDMVEHLFKVVSGIDSMIIGEDQIIGQVKDALKFGLDNATCGNTVARLFNKAIAAGKRVRTETNISKGAASVSSAAVELVCNEMPDINQKKVLLVGTGQTGELALLNLTKRGNSAVYVTNRTFSKAVDIAEKYKGVAFELHELDNYLPLVDVVFVATSSKTYLITRKMVEKAMAQRTDPQLFVDLSVPRNIDQAIVSLPNVRLHAVDDVQQLIDSNTEKRKEAITDAMEIIAQVKQEFNDWLGIQELTPVIMKIKTNFQQINKAELEGFLKINAVKEVDAVSDYANHITEKYARLFIRNLKDVTQNGKNKEYVKLLNNLFELS
jgi:glutamyl-tRNA reductase